MRMPATSGLIVCEQPQTIALIISHLPSELTNRLIDGLPYEKRADVLLRIENMEPIVPEVLDGIATNLKGRIFSSLSGRVNEVDRQAAAPSATRTADKPSAPSMVDGPFADRSVLPMQTSHSSATFDDLVKLRSSSLKSLLQQINASQWAVALMGASEETKHKLFDNLATREKEKLKEEINHLGPVKIGDIKEMQQLVIGAASRLEMVV